jgi:D-hexose-6-phosphate mutarotase
MANLTDLQNRFSSVPGVRVEAGQGGLARVAVSTPAADAHVYFQGAHVTHYQPKGDRPVLFMSGKSHFAAGKAIRGGVPLIFPWFGAKADNPKAPQHGFARSQEWELRDVRPAGAGAGAVDVMLGLSPNDATRAAWPFDFDLLFTVTVGPELGMALEVRNTGDKPFTFEEALHTYLAVADVRYARIDGLAGRQFIDKVDAFQRKTQPAGGFSLTGETDRVYLDTPDTVTVTDDDGRKLVVAKESSASTVVWNPWAAKAKAMADFGDDEWPKMLCIETANAADNVVTLAPGRSHVMRATVRA